MLPSMTRAGFVRLLSAHRGLWSGNRSQYLELLSHNLKPMKVAVDRENPAHHLQQDEVVTAQRMTELDEYDAHGRNARETAQLQRMEAAANSAREQRYAALQRKAEPNRTGMPDRFLNNLESLSGMDMRDVRVHHNSSKPATLQAHAYAQGNQIYLGPGQERHLPHEAWHVVQQKQGRVRPTMHLKGVGINDNVRLEQEADQMGTRIRG
jgi:hypothetical protein